MPALLQACKRIKGLPYILLALVVGLVLLLLPAPSASKSEEQPTDAQAYRRELEAEVEDLLKSLDGVRDCRVVLTLSYGFEYIYATDQRISETENGKQTEKTIVLATESGNQLPLPLREKQPTVCGVAVVCPNATAETRARITTLLQALFSLEGDCISIQS